MFVSQRSEDQLVFLDGLLSPSIAIVFDSILGTALGIFILIILRKKNSSQNLSALYIAKRIIAIDLFKL